MRGVRRVRAKHCHVFAVCLTEGGREGGASFANAFPPSCWRLSRSFDQGANHCSKYFQEPRFPLSTMQWSFLAELLFDGRTTLDICPLTQTEDGYRYSCGYRGRPHGGGGDAPAAGARPADPALRLEALPYSKLCIYTERTRSIQIPHHHPLVLSDRPVGRGEVLIFLRFSPGPLPSSRRMS